MEVYEEGDAICSGLCSQGADRFAVRFAKLLNAPTFWFPADWKLEGKQAGFNRNTHIAMKSDVLIACVAKDRIGGTEDTIRKFMRLKGVKNLIIVKSEQDLEDHDES